MIIQALINLISIVINVIFSNIYIPGLPDEAIGYLDEFLELLDSAAGFFALVFPVNVLPFVVICLGISAAYTYYKMVMWVLRKIPLLGIS